MRRRSLAIGLMLLGLAPGPASADQVAVAFPMGHRSPRQRRIERTAAELFNRAESKVLAAHPRCVPRPMRTFTHAAPSARLLGTLGVLRRPATAADRVPPDLLSELSGDRIELNAARVVHGPGGIDYYIVPSRGGDRLVRPPRACNRLVHARLERLVADRPAAVRRESLRLARLFARFRWPKPAESVSLYSVSEDSVGSSGAARLVDLLAQGVFDVSWTPGHRPLLVALVPDGVATVTVTYPHTGLRLPGRHARPRVYPAALTLTAPVQDNVAWFSVARSVSDAFAPHLVWRAADGSVMRSIPPPSEVNVIR